VADLPTGPRQDAEVFAHLHPAKGDFI
jgi:hypothetical protein